MGKTSEEEEEQDGRRRKGSRRRLNERVLVEGVGEGRKGGGGGVKT